MTKRQARTAAASQSSRRKTADALASAAIIRPFQSASTLSSQPGHTRLSRTAFSLVRSTASRCSSASPSKRRRAIAMEDVVMLPVATGGDVVGRAKERAVLGAQHGVDLGSRPRHRTCPRRLPNWRRRSRQSRRSRRPSRAGSTSQVSAMRAAWSGLLVSCQTRHSRSIELRVVVQHLLEMRDQPFVVGGVAREAAAQVIVDAALAHAVERDGDRVAQLGVAAVAQPAAPQQLEDVGRGEFRRLAEAAPVEIALLHDAVGDLVEQGEREQRPVTCELDGLVDGLRPQRPEQSRRGWSRRPAASRGRPAPRPAARR